MGSSTTVRFEKRAMNSGGPLRRWLAVTLVLISAAGAFMIFSRDIDWESRNREARRFGLTAEHNGNFEMARTYYEAALANHPYDWETHLSLANILHHRLNKQDDALRHYLYALAYSPEPSIVESTRAKIEILRLMRSGKLENPVHALEDMFLTLDAGAEQGFYRRLSISLREDGQTYWQNWMARGRGQITFTRISSTHDGFYDAQMELDFADNTSMSIHMYCPLQDIWRLELSFP